MKKTKTIEVEEVIELILDFYNKSVVGETTTEPFNTYNTLGLDFYLSHIAQGDSHAVLVHEDCDGLCTPSLLIPMNGEHMKSEMYDALEWYFNN